MRKSGRHFLQIPGPTNVPDSILRAISQATIDHRGPDFANLGKRVLDGMQWVFQTDSPVVIFPSSGTGAWEAALVNVTDTGDGFLIYETGQFAHLWSEMAHRHGLEVTRIESDWRRGVEAEKIQAALQADTQHSIKAVGVVHNETSTGVTSNIPAVRAAIDAAGHPALLLVDTISSLGSIDYRHDQWGVDVTVGGSQKGLMLPPGLGFNAISEKALVKARKNAHGRSYWDWQAMLEANTGGYFPYTPATNLLYGLDEAIKLMREEGLEAIFQRHDRFAAATRAAVSAWGLELLCVNEDEYSSSLTAVLMPGDGAADRLRSTVLDRFDMSLGTGLGRLSGRVFRIGHLGDFNDLALTGTLCGIEMGLKMNGVGLAASGVTAALDVLISHNQ